MGHEEDELFAAIEDMNLMTDAPSTDVPGTDPPSTDSPSTDAPSTDAPSTDAPATEAPTTEAPAEDESERLKRENEELRKKLEDKYGASTDAPSTQAPTTQAPPEDYVFVKNEDELENLLRNPEDFNKLLNSVYRRGAEDIIRQSSESTLRGIPSVVRHNVDLALKMKAINDKFYSDNEDLKPFKKIVASHFEAAVSEHPDWKVDDLLGETEKRTRSTLELHKKATEPPKKNPPKLPPGSKGSKQQTTKPKTSSLQAEIDEMNREDN